jgi:hypothetical protein
MTRSLRKLGDGICSCQSTQDSWRLDRYMTFLDEAGDMVKNQTMRSRKIARRAGDAKRVSRSESQHCMIVPFPLPSFFCHQCPWYTLYTRPHQRCHQWEAHSGTPSGSVDTGRSLQDVWVGSQSYVVCVCVCVCVCSAGALGQKRLEKATQSCAIQSF